MKYIIVEGKKCLNVESDKNLLLTTLKYIEKTESDIKEVEDDEIELAYDGCYYMKGFAPIQPVDEYNQQQSEARSKAYIERTDPLTLRKIRKTALNEWNESEELNYIEQIKRISEEIEKDFPYR